MQRWAQGCALSFLARLASGLSFRGSCSTHGNTGGSQPTDYKVEERARVATANMGAVDRLFKNIFAIFICDGEYLVLFCTRNIFYLSMFLLKSNFPGAIFLSPLMLSHVPFFFQNYF